MRARSWGLPRGRQQVRGLLAAAHPDHGRSIPTTSYQRSLWVWRRETAARGKRTGAREPRRITDELERDYFVTYPEMRGRVRRPRVPPPTERYDPPRWRRTAHSLLVVVLLMVLVWLGPAATGV